MRFETLVTDSVAFPGSGGCNAPARRPANGGFARCKALAFVVAMCSVGFASGAWAVDEELCPQVTETMDYLSQIISNPNGTDVQALAESANVVLGDVFEARCIPPRFSSVAECIPVIKEEQNLSRKEARRFCRELLL